MQVSQTVLGIWVGLFLFSVLIIGLDYKLYNISSNDRKRITKSIIYSFLIGIGIVLIPIVLEILFPLLKNCSALSKSWLVDCGGTYINLRYIQTTTILCYFVIVFCVWGVWNLCYGKLYRISVRFERVIRYTVILLGLLMMLPLAWLRNFLLEI